MRIRSNYDVIVVGAGTAGAFAAIAAARTGAKTLVIEQYGSIGGVLSLGMTLLGTSDAEGYKTLGGIGGEMFDRLIPANGGTKTSLDPLFGSIATHDPELSKLTLLEMAKESGVDFLLHTFVADVLMDGSRVKGIMVANKGGLEIITAKCFVDCTGDADITARANGKYTIGRESDSLTQPVSAIFRVGGVKVERVWEYLERNPGELHVPDGLTGQAQSVAYLRQTPGAHLDTFRQLIIKARKAGDFNIPRDGVGISTLPNRDEVTVNITRVHGIDGTNPDDVTRAEIETQMQTLHAMRFLRKYAPGFENAHIVSAPYQVGIRETRHIIGAHILNKDDILTGRDFEDQIGRGAYPLDVHDVKAGTAQLNVSEKGSGISLSKIHRSYGIPARSLVPLGVDNVTVGGRSISATHEAAGSIRGQAVCMVTGHAAGTMAAMTALYNTTLAKLPTQELQAMLRSQNAILERNLKLEGSITK